MSTRHRKLKEKRKEIIEMTTMADYTRDLEQLTALLRAGVSPFHTILYSSSYLDKLGFTPLSLNSHWELEPGGSYYVNVYDSTLAAFRIGPSITDNTGSSPLHIASAHTDWPCLMLKPAPEIASGAYGKLNVSVYGGPILNTWLDRPLSLAGKVCLRAKDPFNPDARFVCFERPLLTVPNLAIHFNREVNRGIELNPQTDMQPVISVLNESLNRNFFFTDLLAEKLGCSREDILDYQFCLYNCDEPQVLGIQNEMLSAPRLDNLTSVQACLSGITASRPENGIRMAVLYDNEEIGSSTKQGAASLLAERILEKIYLSLGFSRETLLNALLGGFLLSLDVAHALHPNKMEKYDPVDRICLNEGVALKLSVSQAYATDASCVSTIEQLCLENSIPCRKFSNRSDIRGGSTLGSISSCFMNMRAVDAGVPILAMHSARELMGCRDQAALTRLTEKFLE